MSKGIGIKEVRKALLEARALSSLFDFKECRDRSKCPLVRCEVIAEDLGLEDRTSLRQNAGSLKAAQMTIAKVADEFGTDSKGKIRRDRGLYRKIFGKSAPKKRFAMYDDGVALKIFLPYDEYEGGTMGKANSGFFLGNVISESDLEQGEEWIELPALCYSLNRDYIRSPHRERDTLMVMRRIIGIIDEVEDTARHELRHIIDNIVCARSQDDPLLTEIVAEFYRGEVISAWYYAKKREELEKKTKETGEMKESLLSNSNLPQIAFNDIERIYGGQIAGFQATLKIDRRMLKDLIEKYEPQTLSFIPVCVGLHKLYDAFKILAEETITV